MTQYTPEEIAKARAIIADVEKDKKVKAEEAKRKKEAEKRLAVEKASGLVEEIRTAFYELRELSAKYDLQLNLFDIYELAQELDTETDWDSSSLYC